jgi:hypothetical protein
MRTLVNDVSLDAVRAHAVVEAFGLRSTRVEGAKPDAGALEALARATGGQFAAMGKDVDQVVGRIVAGSSSCYVLGLDSRSDPGTRHALSVTTPRAGVVMRAPAWLVARPDVADCYPPAGGAPAAAPLPTSPLRFPDPSLRSGTSATPAQSAELRRLLARVADYVGTYQREYSTVVAEEDYEQSDRRRNASPRSLRLTSDLLLVRLDPQSGWVGFRDVYEVNGKPVRDRDQRLQRLFLDRSLEGRARLEAILAESSKYNLGPVTRTVNVPLFALTFLEKAWQSRFSFSLGGTEKIDGLALAVLDYRETASPTIASALDGADQPARGRFFVDSVSGAVVESQTIYGREAQGQFEYRVRFRRDEKLGLWLPAEMKETYTLGGVVTSGVARYRNFRRFQVTTDIQMAAPKGTKPKD